MESFVNVLRIGQKKTPLTVVEWGIPPKKAYFLSSLSLALPTAQRLLHRDLSEIRKSACLLYYITDGNACW